MLVCRVCVEAWKPIYRCGERVGLRESGERVSLSVAVKKAGAFELFAETLARFPVSSLAHRNATLARGQLRDALDRPEPPLNVREPWPMFGTHCVMS